MFNLHIFWQWVSVCVCVFENGLLCFKETVYMECEESRLLEWYRWSNVIRVYNMYKRIVVIYCNNCIHVNVLIFISWMCCRLLASMCTCTCVHIHETWLSDTTVHELCSAHSFLSLEQSKTDNNDEHLGSLTKWLDVASELKPVYNYM